MVLKPKAIVGFLVVLGLVGGLGWAVYQKVAEHHADDGGSRGERDAAVAVELSEIQRTAISNVRTFTGTLEPRSAFNLAPKVSGRLDRLHADIGDTVERGTLVAELDDAETIQEVEEARAALAVARANLDEVHSGLTIAEREYERYRTLREERIASESELDSALSQFEAKQSQMRVAEAQVQQREAALRAAEIRQSYTRIHATWDGGDDRRVVGERFADEGDMLSANAPVLSLLDIDTLRAVIFVAERDYPNVRIGQSASLMADAYPAREFDAEAVRVSPQFQRGSRQARVELLVPNDDHLLKPGMFARVRLEVGRADDAAVVPLGAIVRRQNQVGVFIADEEQRRARFVPVQTGFSHGGQVQILEPALEGKVVTLGQHLLADESPIRVAAAAEEPPDDAEAEAAAALD